MPKVIYISGPITGVAEYQKNFDRAEADLLARGYAVLNPAKLPKGLTREQYMRIDLAMIDCADGVLFLPDWHKSEGARLEREYCIYTLKAWGITIELLEEMMR